MCVYVVGVDKAHFLVTKNKITSDVDLCFNENILRKIHAVYYKQFSLRKHDISCFHIDHSLRCIDIHSYPLI